MDWIPNPWHAVTVQIHKHYASIILILYKTLNTLSIFKFPRRLSQNPKDDLLQGAKVLTRFHNALLLSILSCCNTSGGDYPSNVGQQVEDVNDAVGGGLAKDREASRLSVIDSSHLAPNLKKSSKSPRKLSRIQDEFCRSLESFRNDEPDDVSSCGSNSTSMNTSNTAKTQTTAIENLITKVIAHIVVDLSIFLPALSAESLLIRGNSSLYVVDLCRGRMLKDLGNKLRISAEQSALIIEQIS